MSVEAAQAAPPRTGHQARVRAIPRHLSAYLRRNPSLIIGLVLLSTLLAAWLVGYEFVDVNKARPLSVRPNQTPSALLPFGSDRQGRNILAVLVVGTPLTLLVGLIAATVGTAVAIVIAFTAGYYGGWWDAVVRLVVDTFQTVPGLLVLVLIAISMRSRTGMSVGQMALVIGALAWLTPTRLIRAQVLVLKGKLFVELARQSGMRGPEIIFRELLPNLAPYVVANFVTAFAAAILASIGLEALGLGPIETNTLGMTIYWNIYYTSILHGMWWWYGPPIAIIVWLFVRTFPRIDWPRRMGESTGAEERLNILDVRGLSVHYRGSGGLVNALDDVSFQLASGERLALVGESGSGKSTLAMALMRLIRPPGVIREWFDQAGRRGSVDAWP